MPVTAAGRNTLPGIAASRRFLVAATTTMVRSLLRLKGLARLHDHDRPA